jgi:protein involved in polysaccharide export with SLBB domain
MHFRMTETPFGRALGALAVALALAGCGHRAPSNGAPPAALQPPAPPQPGPSYRIQLGDELHVRFLFQPDMSEVVPVRPDGRISLVSAGEIYVVGLTPPELERVVVERSSTHFRNPEVTVIVTKLGEQRVYIGGEVLSPGYIALRAGMTPLQAVLERGGFKPTAKKDSVILLTQAADGQFSAVRMNLKQVVEDGVPERVRLHPNDVIYVPLTWIGNTDNIVDEWVRGLVPSFPRVGAGYSIQ